jgi:threonine aldolase
MKIVDLRSDTVTKPSAAMREFMFQAEVGDDVFGEDPAINELETYAAELFGKEAGLYCSSGTQTNQIAIAIASQARRSFATKMPTSTNMKVVELPEMPVLLFE